MTGGEEGATRTFELLANETRCGIVRALGDASGQEGYATLAFSELQEAVGVEDNGKFNYHLKQLTDEFVEDKEDGYGLTLAGLRAYQTIVAHETGQDVEVEPFAISGECDVCGHARSGWYEGGRAYLGCTACDNTDIRYPVSTTAFDPDDPTSLLEALDARLKRDYLSMFNGLCPYCAGETAVSLEESTDHWDAEGMNPAEILVHAACSTCGWFLYANLGAVLLSKMPLIAFCQDHGVDLWTEYTWLSTVDWAVDSVGENPPRIEGHLSRDGDRLEFVLDGDLDLLEHELVEAADGAQDPDET